MEENQTPHPDYVKGFNEGYTISKHLPELAQKLPGSIGNSLRSTGFQDGRDQHMMEQKKERYPAWLKTDRLSTPDNTPSKTKDKDMDEPERE